MKLKKKICSGCGSENYIFSAGLCKACATRLKYAKNQIKVSSQKSRDKRRGVRAGYEEFFTKHMKNIHKTKAKCLECGCRLKGHVSEVAHILPKSSYPSVATNDKNVIYLCGHLSDSNCHAKFDNTSHTVVRSMKIFPIVKEKFIELKDSVSEKISLKLLNLYNE